MPTLSEILNSKIGKQGKSKASVAAHLDVSERTVENYMKGSRQPKPEALAKLSKFLGFDLNELFEQNVPHGTNAEKSPQASKKANGLHISHKAESMVNEESPSYNAPVQDKYITLLEDSLKEKKDQLKELQARLSDLEGRQRDFLAKVEDSIERYEHLVLAQLQALGASKEQGSTPTVLAKSYRTEGKTQKKDKSHKPDASG